MADFGAIDDLEGWFVEKSQPGFGPFIDYDARGFAPDVVRLIQEFQFSGLSQAIRVQRESGECSTQVADLTRFVKVKFDGQNYVAYRGLGAEEIPSSAASRNESSLNSWSLYPSKALRIALAHAGQPYSILRLRMTQKLPCLYLDSFEDEFLCPPMKLSLGRRYKGEINFLGEKLELCVIDCGCMRNTV